MSTPITPPGHPDAQQPAPPRTDKVTELGQGHVFGNLCDDPELRFTPQGTAVTRLRVAYTPRVKADDGKSWRDGPTEFYNVNVWRNQAERCAEHLRRGDRVVIAGAWTQRTWTDREQNERVSVELTAQDVGASMLFRSVAIDRETQESN